MSEWIDRLLGRRRPRPALAARVKKAIRDRDAAFDDLGAAITEVDLLKNGIIRDFEAAEQDHRKP